MTDESDGFDINELEAFFAESHRWATLSITIQEIADKNKKLVNELSLYDPTTTIPLLGSLLTLPQYQSNCIRIEILIALAVTNCTGKKKPTVSDVARWFYSIGKSHCVIGEDPSEDVFVSLVQDENGDYRLLEGIWEGAGFYTQRIIDVVSTMPDEFGFKYIKNSVRAILAISDLVCEKSGLKRYQLGSDEISSRIFPNKIPKRSQLVSRVSVSFEEFNAFGFNLEDIDPFIFDPAMRKDLASHQIGNSYLERFPLAVLSDNKISVVQPSAISVALRSFVIEAIYENGLVKSFNSALAKKYSQLFYETPLIGGPVNAPVVWKKNEEYRITNFAFEVDEGYYISYHAFLPAIEAHRNGGFKTIIEDDGKINNELQSSIEHSVKALSKKSNFKGGLVVIVGCGWGKGYAIQAIEFDYPKWRFESMSSADLFRLSWVADINPRYFWRIQNGLEAIEKSGIKIVNPNGILNLIGWVRENNGHFFPHSQLADEDISPDRPLMLQIPQNLLRNIRADADNSLDRHSSLDSDGRWHDVQYFSASPLFQSDSSKKLYVSISDVSKGKLTAVYEGKYHLWISIRAPNLENREMIYRLWEMGHEWLHRIGAEFDKTILNKSDKSILNVNVEFEDDLPLEEIGPKPTRDQLFSKCKVSAIKEENSCTAIFEPGFLEGFRISENVAERLFVFNVIRGFLNLIREDDIDIKAESLTEKVVKNNEARSFHFFQAQKFLDYVRDTLPKELVEIDAINDGIAKLGLGWRVHEKGDGNKINGKKSCTSFLGKVVDALINEVLESLANFDRTSTIFRLISNCEKAAVEEDHWKRTSAAVLGLHGESENTIKQYVEQNSKYAGTGVASRVLIEMALCTCPLNSGNRISDIELSELIARAALIVRYGGLSDAIYFSALSPELQISPLGDILFRDDLGELVVQPMLSKFSSEKFVANAPNQKKNYEEPGFIVSTKESFDGEFWDIWIGEMGFSLDEGREIISSLEDKGIEDHTAILELKQSEYFSLVCSGDISNEVASNFLGQFLLQSRLKWDKVPKTFAKEDIYPWRFGRRLSYVTRPILEVDDNPTLIIAPGSLRNGFTYLVDGTYNGRFKQSFFQTEQLKNGWWGKASEGHSFNERIEKKLSEIGWKVRGNIGIPEILNVKTDRNYGDVDVLAWKDNSNEILVVECKDLSLARNYSEVAALLSTFQGVVNEKGKRDKLRLHLDRVTLLEANIDKLRKFTRNKEAKVVSCLVFSGVVPMQFAKIDALETTRVGTVEDILYPVH